MIDGVPVCRRRSGRVDCGVRSHLRSISMHVGMWRDGGAGVRRCDGHAVRCEPHASRAMNDSIMIF